MMARKRMFRTDVLDTDAFLDMPLSAQALYFHLNLRADDDGFIGNPKRITSTIGASIDDLKLLVAKRFVIVFDDGVIVIKHWRMHNTIQKDRYTPTVYTEDLAMLGIKENRAYTLNTSCAETVCIQNDSKMETNCIQNGNTDIDKNRKDIDKDIDLDISSAQSLSQKAPTPMEEEADVELIPLSDGSGWRPTISEYKEYERLFPDVDIDKEFRKMRAWSLSNSKKTKRGIKRFVTGWLSRAQDRPSGKTKGKTGSDSGRDYLMAVAMGEIE